MRYREFRPSEPVRSFVERYWTLDAEGGAADVQKVVPDGRAELILNLGEPFEAFHDGRWQRQPVCFLAGQITGPLLLRPRGPAHIIGVHFRPHGAAQFFGLPMRELSDSFTPAADLSPALARELADARTVAQLDETMARRASALSEDRLMGEAVRHILQTRGAVDIAGLARALNLSSRQLERRFKSGVGLSPKLFCRIQRFQQVFHVIGAERPDWVTAAVECGYYDQAHLIHDFKDFSGETPAVLLAGDELARHFLSDFSNTTPAASR
jgi:AraC-like DNA-binding protein